MREMLRIMRDAPHMREMLRIMRDTPHHVEGFMVEWH